MYGGATSLVGGVCTLLPYQIKGCYYVGIRRHTFQENCHSGTLLVMGSFLRVELSPWNLDLNSLKIP
jgi:hypothetical protein